MIEVVDLVKWHGAIEVLRGVSLAVVTGEVAAIIGPSGSGKSTFLRCLNGLESFQSGCVTIDGLRIDAAGAIARSGRGSIARSACRVGHGLPELQPVPAPDGARERDGRARSTCWA